MRRTLVAVSLCLAAVVAPAAASHRDGAASPALRAVLAACSAGPTEDERFAVFTGSMPARSGTRQMAMRFDLQVRREGTMPWSSQRARGFGRWLRSQTGRSGFVYTKRVERLEQGVEYRSVVSFRWHGADGRVLRRTARRSRVCRQPDLRPNLRVGAVEVLPGPDGSTARYRVTIANSGRSAAGPFEVAVDATVRQVAGLPAGEKAVVELVARRCTAAGRPEFVVDRDGVVEESDEDDNRFSPACTGR